jgi:hypothetical protein
MAVLGKLHLYHYRYSTATPKLQGQRQNYTNCHNSPDNTKLYSVFGNLFFIQKGYCYTYSLGDQCHDSQILSWLLEQSRGRSWCELPCEIINQKPYKCNHYLLVNLIKVPNFGRGKV